MKIAEGGNGNANNGFPVSPSNWPILGEFVHPSAAKAAKKFIWDGAAKAAPLRTIAEKVILIGGGEAGPFQNI